MHVFTEKHLTDGYFQASQTPKQTYVARTVYFKTTLKPFEITSILQQHNTTGRYIMNKCLIFAQRNHKEP